MHFFHQSVAPGHNVPDHGVQQCLDSVRASFNLVKVFFCFFFFLEMLLVLLGAKRKDNDDVLMLMCTRAKSVTSLQPV